MNLDFPALLAELAAERPLFHSEPDFQHALAWKLLTTFPDAQLQLDYSPVSKKAPRHDIWLDADGVSLAIDVKYVTRKLTAQVDGNLYNLKNQSIEEARCYDFARDISRLENIVQTRPGALGYALFLTNNSTYWTHAPDENDSAGKDFRLFQGNTLGGVLNWNGPVDAETLTGREEPLRLTHTYELSWHGYSQISNVPQDGSFRYLLVKVSPSDTSPEG